MTLVCPSQILAQCEVFEENFSSGKNEVRKIVNKNNSSVNFKVHLMPTLFWLLRLVQLVDDDILNFCKGN